MDGLLGQRLEEQLAVQVRPQAALQSCCIPCCVWLAAAFLLTELILACHVGISTLFAARHLDSTKYPVYNLSAARKSDADCGGRAKHNARQNRREGPCRPNSRRNIFATTSVIVVAAVVRLL